MSITTDTSGQKRTITPASTVPCLLLLVPIFRPIAIDYLTASFKLFDLMTIGFAVFLGIRLMGSEVHRIRGLCLVLVCPIATLAATILNHGNITEQAIVLIQYILIVEILTFYRNRYSELISSLMLASELCIYLNLLSLVLFPNGLYNREVSGYTSSIEWVLGVSNYFAQWLFPGLIVSWMYATYFQRFARTVLLTCAILITELTNGSGTGTVGIVLFLVLYLLPVKRILPPARTMLLTAIIIVSIILFRSIDAFRPIIEALGKDMTFSNRVYIWDNAIQAIASNPILGYGHLDNSGMVQYLGIMPSGILWEGATHCHDQFLQYLFQGGIVALFGFLASFILVIRSSISKWPSDSSIIATYAAAAYLIMCITEVFTFPLMLMVLPLQFASLQNED